MVTNIQDIILPHDGVFLYFSFCTVYYNVIMRKLTFRPFFDNFV